MPKIRTAIQSSREFKDADLPDCSTKDPLIIRVNQASEGQRIERQTLTITPIRRRLNAAGEFSEEQVLAGYRYQMAVEVFLTLGACNIEDASGDELFEFEKGIMTGTFDHFVTQWGRILHREWADRIHDHVLEVNPDWGYNPPAAPAADEEAEPEQPGEAPPADAG